MYIDDHVHCRDEEEKEKETIAHALLVAEHSGVDAIFDQPNTKRPVVKRERVLERFALAEAADSPVIYATHVGVTSDAYQIEEAVECVREFSFDRMMNDGRRFFVCGLKMFAGKSVGDLSVPDAQDQLNVYKTLARLEYEGVLVDHCEKESEMHPESWNPDNPFSHYIARPERAEIESVKDQINFAIEAGYKGHLHIAHVSCIDSAKIINSQRFNLRISMGVTPHHLLLDYEIMKGEHGIFYKVNPPLRSHEDQKFMLEHFAYLAYFDTLETDHAPHTLDDKLDRFMSGIPGLASWPDFVRILARKGARSEIIDAVTFDNVNRIYGTNIPKLGLAVKPGLHLHEYVMNAYKDFR